MVKEALVVKRDTLLKDKSFEGFLPVLEYDYFPLILRHFEYHPRGEQLEHDVSLKQIIPYVWIVNPRQKTVFLYKRSPNGNGKHGEYREIRYLNKYAGGVGGHIDRDTEEGVSDPVQHAMMRELEEEVEMPLYPQPKIIGYLNDNTDGLGMVHFGIVALAETHGPVSCRSAEGLSSGAFYSIDEVEHILATPTNEVENWTRLSWSFVKAYLLKK